MGSALVIPAAGNGTRFGSAVPKQFLEIHGRAVLTWTLLAFRGLVEEVVLVGDDRDRLLACAAAAGVTPTIVAGGATRQHSVANGLRAVRSDRALIHDAVRPCVPRACIIACLKALDLHPAAVVAIPCSSTVKRAKDGIVAATVPRADLWLAQTPQGVRLAEALPAYAQAEREDWICTDDAEVMEKAGHRVAIISGDARNLKITTPDDLAVAAALLSVGS